MDKLTEVLNQAPADVDEDYVKTIFAKNQENVSNTLAELWNMPITPAKEKTKWENIRDTCDEYDNEMNRIIKNMKAQSQSQAQVEHQG